MEQHCCATCKFYDRLYFIHKARLMGADYGTCLHTRTIRRLRNKADVCPRYCAGAVGQFDGARIDRELRDMAKNLRDISILLRSREIMLPVSADAPSAGDGEMRG